MSLSLPVFNGANYLEQALGSIIAQDYKDFELIITDNASTDDTEAICRRFATSDPRIRYHRNTQNLGAAANFNRGFELSSGCYFKWCAHDDLINESFLTECVRALEENSQAVIAYPILRRIDENGAMTDYVEPALPDIREYSPARRFRTLIATNGMDSAMFGLWRRDAMLKTSLHRPYYGSDCALLAEMALLGSFAQVPEAILYNRDHPKRSVNLPSSERLVWQNPNGSSANASELAKRVRHLIAIAYRHRNIAPFHQTLYYVIAWTAHPLLMGRLALEAIGLFSPTLRDRVRNFAMTKLRGAP